MSNPRNRDLGRPGHPTQFTAPAGAKSSAPLDAPAGIGTGDDLGVNDPWLHAGASTGIEGGATEHDFANLDAAGISDLFKSHAERLDSLVSSRTISHTDYTAEYDRLVMLRTSAQDALEEAPAAEPAPIDPRAANTRGAFRCGLCGEFATVGEHECPQRENFGDVRNQQFVSFSKQPTWLQPGDTLYNRFNGSLHADGEMRWHVERVAFEGLDPDSDDVFFRMDDGTLAQHDFRHLSAHRPSVIAPTDQATTTTAAAAQTVAPASEPQVEATSARQKGPQPDGSWDPYWEVDDEIRTTLCNQIGRSTILAASGGRIVRIADGIELPDSRTAYRVRVHYCPNDTYAVERIYAKRVRGVPTEYVHGRREEVYADEVGEAVYYASCFASYDRDEWLHKR